MYIRKKHNRSGTISVVVVSKNGGKYKEIKSFGCSSLESEIELLCEKARKWIHSFGGQREFDFDNKRTRELEETIRVVDSGLMNKKILVSDKNLNWHKSESQSQYLCG